MADGKSLPHSIQAEQCVLGCFLLDYIECGDGLDRLKKEDFFSPTHQVIYDVMHSLVGKKEKTIDFVTVAEALKGVGKLDAIGGIAYLNELNNVVPSTANFRHYFDIVKSNSILRKLNFAGKKITEESFQSDDAYKTLAEAEKAVFQIGTQEERKELTPIGDEVPAVMDRLDEISKNPAIIYGIRTGFYDFDVLTNGLHGGELIVLAARPGVGKTSLGLNIVLNAAGHSKKKCAIFSLEMSKRSLTQRALCSLASISSSRAGKGELSKGELHRLWQASETLQSYKIFIDDNSDITPIEIKRKCLRLKREHGLDLVMVDYLGLMNSGNMSSSGVRYENRQNEVAANSRAMKILSKELDIPVLLLAQLNRNVESRGKDNKDRRPALHDLRDSGAIEQDADIVVFIHTDTKPPEATDLDGGEKAVEIKSQSNQSEPELAEIIIAKHRNGQMGSFHLEWHKEFTTFLGTKASRDADAARDKAAVAAETREAKVKTEQPEMDEVAAVKAVEKVKKSHKKKVAEEKE
jgi:replicative DNA helicase